MRLSILLVRIDVHIYFTGNFSQPQQNKAHKFKNWDTKEVEMIVHDSIFDVSSETNSMCNQSS